MWSKLSYVSSAPPRASVRCRELLGISTTDDTISIRNNKGKILLEPATLTVLVVGMTVAEGVTVETFAAAVTVMVEVCVWVAAVLCR